MIEVQKFELLNRVIYYPEKPFLIRSNDDYSLIEADIKSAYPSLLKIHFSDIYFDIEKNIEQVDEKIVRNILISTGATEILTELQNLAKRYLLQFIKEILNGVYVIEFKKDGGVFLISNQSFKKAYEYNSLIFKVNTLSKYIRFSNTSFYYYTDNTFIIKGKYKYVPKYIYDFYINELSKQKILDFYADLYKTICDISNNIKELSNLFLCMDKEQQKHYILDEKGKYVEIDNFNKLYSVKPFVYKQTFILPFIKLEYTIN